MSAKRVFVCGIRQESNSFNPCLCKMEMFFSNANRSMEESLIAIRKDNASQAAGSVSVLDAAGYEPISDGIYNTNTPGAAGVVLTDLPYERRPVPLYPFEEITEKDITEPECFRYKEK